MSGLICRYDVCIRRTNENKNYRHISNFRHDCMNESLSRYLLRSKIYSRWLKLNGYCHDLNCLKKYGFLNNIYDLRVFLERTECESSQ